MAQATKKKAPLVPKLRFKEFAADGEWEVDIFDALYTFKTTNSLSRDNLNYRRGTVKNTHYGDIHTKFSAHFDINKEIVPYINDDEFIGKIKESSYCTVGDLIFADASEDLKDIGKCIEIVNLNNEKLLSGLHTLLARPNGNNFVGGFCGHLFQSAYIRTQVQKEAQGTKILGISASRLSKINVCYPKINEKPRLSEQQRISDCLTSLDENITAESQKLEALTAHKKALMQKLFPAEGEKVPALRFKEFAGAGEWEEKRLGELCKFVRGPFGGALKKEIFVKSGYAVYEQSHAIYNQFESFRYFITHEKYAELKRFAVETNDIIMSCSGTMAKFAIIPEKSPIGVINQALLKLTVNISTNIQFIKIFLESSIIQNKLLSQSAGGAIQNVVSVDQLKNILFCIPSSSEQQRIADCLTSLDEYITAQGQKIALLKEHKKGLMQQLFPRMEEENL